MVLITYFTDTTVCYDKVFQGLWPCILYGSGYEDYCSPTFNRFERTLTVILEILD